MNYAYAKETPVVKRTDAERAFCDSEFWKIVGDDLQAGSPEKVAAWKALEPKCSGTGTYESRLVGLMTYNGQIDEARKLGLAAMQKPLDSKRELLVALAEVEAQRRQPGAGDRLFEARDRGGRQLVRRLRHRSAKCCCRNASSPRPSRCSKPPTSGSAP